MPRIHDGVKARSGATRSRRVSHVEIVESMDPATSLTVKDEVGGKAAGVLLRGEDPNPYKRYATMDSARQIPPNTLHQDASARVSVEKGVTAPRDESNTHPRSHHVVLFSAKETPWTPKALQAMGQDGMFFIGWTNIPAPLPS